MTFDYNAEFDVLYVWFGDSKKAAESIESKNGDVVRFDPDTQTVLSVTVIAFMERLQRGDTISIPEVSTIPFNAIMQSIVSGKAHGRKEN